MEFITYSACGNIIGLLIQVPKSLDPQLYYQQVDQLLIYNPPEVVIYNQNGSLATQCGNGLRTLAHHLGPKNHCFYLNNKMYSTTYQPPFHWVEFPLPKVESKNYLSVPYSLVDVGNLHAIFDNRWHFQYAKLIPLLQDCNISFIEINGSVIEITTYERGVGYTRSCGSAAAGAAYLASLKNPINTWEVQSQGGVLTTTIADKVLQTGSVTLEHIHT